ncbi:hypothetical protein LCGC14_0972890 [marine sediment metagenome]|uniref:Phage terminase large subunit GpA ATPase domain-containing protein n=1 Tax=marine sediment metagenome TaxID=412755 RepID=A0A0F9NXA6_9ZZZZ
MDELLKKLIVADPLVWAHTKRLLTKSGDVYSLRNHAYQANLLQDEKRVTNIKKGTQLGLTLIYQLMAIHGLIYKKYPQGVLYMMPSEKLVERFSKLRFTPMFEDNKWLKKYLLINNVNEKIINGGSLIFVGARAQKVGGTSVKDSDALRTFECDCVIRDEIDRHDMDMVEQSKQRLNYSKIRQEVNLGSPTYPDYGIDSLYENSDQSQWQIKCDSCGKHTCLETDWESAIIKKNGEWYRSCLHCQTELDPNKGEWNALYPDREEAGRWVSGWLSPRADLRTYILRIRESEGNKHCEALRSICGQASIEAENQLSETTILSRCTKDDNQMISTGETAMGVDIGKKIHVVVGIRTAREAYDILHVSRLNDLTELHDLALKMNVRYCVIDSGPHDFGVLEFQKTEPYTIYLCQYSEQMPGKPKFNGKERMVKVNRNEWCDKVHTTFAENRIRIPRVSAEINQFAHEMTRTAKQIIEHPDTGILKPRWIKLGADHYFHAALYFLLASSRTSPRQRGRTKINRPTHSVNLWN